MTGRRGRILFLAHRFPYPPDKGDKIRSWHLLSWLAERYDVSLGAFIDDPEDWQHLPVIEAICKESCILPLGRGAGSARALRGLMTDQALSFAWYRDGRMARFVRRERLNGLDLEVYFSGAMTIFAEGASAPVLTDLVDADSAKWQSYAGEGPFWKRWLYAREARRVAEAEGRAVRLSRKTFLVTPEEEEVLSVRPGIPSNRLDYYRNGVDLAFWNPQAVAPFGTPYDLVFTGAMDYRPNAEGAVWFSDNVWPRLKELHPDITFAIVGRHPTPAVTALGERPGITVTGRVEDIRPYLKNARVAVAPLAIARGVQNKVLEAMAMSVPVVASPEAVAGTGAEPGRHLIEAGDAEAMAAAIDGLLADPDRAAALGAEGRALMTSRYSWDETLKRFEAALPESLRAEDTAS